MEKNDIVTLKITDVTASGSGVGRIVGKAVFVPFSAVGDVLEVLIVKVKTNYCFGKILNIIEPSESRIEDTCGVFTKCGGCVFRHISYKSETAIKQNAVQNNIRRIGGFTDFFVENIVSNDVRSDRYRNKAQYPVSKTENGEIKIGFYSPRSHRVNECLDCKLQPERFEKILFIIKQFLTSFNISIYNEETNKGLLRHIYLRQADKTNEIMVVLVINGGTVPNIEILVSELQKELGEDLKSVQLNINREDTNVILGDESKTIYGRDYIIDILCGVKFRVSAGSFYQVNRDMAENLYKKAIEYAEPRDKTVLDLYCGAGTIGLCLAKEAKKIVGVEIVESAVKDANFNKELNGIENAEFICSDAGEAVEKLHQQGIKPDVCLLDPPRKGCEEKLLNIVAKGFSPEQIVYVSCDSATLSRDCKILSTLGYKLEKVTPFDLFPRTAHVETVCLLSRKDK